jgi:predicted CopG family antitoxin
MPDDKTTVEVTDETWKRLLMRKNRGDTFDDVITEALDLAEQYEEEQDES